MTLKPGVVKGSYEELLISDREAGDPCQDQRFHVLAQKGTAMRTKHLIALFESCQAHREKVVPEARRFSGIRAIVRQPGSQNEPGSSGSSRGGIRRHWVDPLALSKPYSQPLPRASLGP